MRKIIIFLAIMAVFMLPAQAYDCWKGDIGDIKDGKYGTFDKTLTTVPNASVVPCTEYQTWEATQPKPVITPILEDVNVPVSTLPTATQTAISAAVGAGAAYLVVRRKKP